MNSRLWRCAAPRIRPYIFLPLLGLVNIALFAAGPPVFAAWEDDIGFTQLQSELTYVPSGLGVAVSQVEAELPNTGPMDYIPDPAGSQFSGKTIRDITGQNESYSGHATSVARFFYGNQESIAPGVSNVSVYEASDYLSHTLGSGVEVPPLQPYRVQNHSWIGSGSGVDRSQRLDYAIDNSEMTTIVSLGNSTGPVPQLLAHSYNALAVGRTDGNHSFGETFAFGSGRTKPSLVAPSGATSFAAAMTSSAAAMLHETAKSTAAARSEPMRAILLAGATKDDFSNWSHTTTSPLDPIFGAGELNVRNSFYILTGGRYTGSNGVPSTAAPAYGWDYRPGVSPGSGRHYEFVVPERKVAGEFSLILTWNSLVTDANGNAAGFFPTDSLANMDLRLFDSSNGFLANKIDESRSAVDNIEHIYQQNLGEGEYTLLVSTDTTRDYGLAWRMSLFDVADTDRDSDVDTADITTFFQNFTGDIGTSGRKTIFQGDTDQDGDVDTTDITLAFQTFTGQMPAALAQFALLQQDWNTENIAAAQIALGIGNKSMSSPVPEPSAFALSLLGFGGLIALGGRIRRAAPGK